MADRTPAQIGKANREAGKRAERKVAQYLEAHGLGNGRRNLAGYARDHGDVGPVTDRDGDRWVVEVKSWQDPTPGKVEAAAREAAREAEHASAPLWVLVVRRPRCADVGRWWACVPTWAMRGWISGIGPAVRRSVWAYDPASHPDDLVQMPLRQWVALVAPDQEATA